LNDSREGSLKNSGKRNLPPYSPENNQFRPTYDSWYINRDGLIPIDTELHHAHAFSSNYIGAYVKKNGENDYFSVVADLQR
jgi:hypothetical protein